MTRVRLPLLPSWLRWTVVAIVAGGLFYGSVLVVPPESATGVDPPGPFLVDKWLHFVGYAALAGALAYATTHWEWRARNLAILVLGAAVLYGVGVEVWQSFVPARGFSAGDAVANALGAALVAPYYAVRSRLSFVPVGRWLGDGSADGR